MPDTAQRRQRVLVILAAHGEAEGRGFREHLAVSWRTLHHAAEVMPLPRALRAVICVVGALRKRFGANAASRHNAVTRAQARALADALADDPTISYQVVAAFASSEPGVAAVLTAAPPDGSVLLCSMIPTDSRLSCGLFCRAAASPPLAAVSRPLARLWEDTGLVAVHQAHLASWLQQQGHAGPAQPDGALVIALHGTLIADKAGKPAAFHNGSQEKSRYGEALRNALGELPGSPWTRVELAYLNHAVGGHWSQPTLEDGLDRLAREGTRSVWVYPAEHLAESIETVRLSQTLAAGPIRTAHCIPCLNDSPRFIDHLAERVRTASAHRQAQPCDHCPLAPGPCPASFSG